MLTAREVTRPGRPGGRPPVRGRGVAHLPLQRRSPCGGRRDSSELGDRRRWSGWLPGPEILGSIRGTRSVDVKEHGRQPNPGKADDLLHRSRSRHGVTQLSSPEPIRRLRRVQAARPPVQPRQMLSRRRLADAELGRGSRDRAGSDVGAQDLELPAGRPLLRHQPAFRYVDRPRSRAAGVTFSSTNRGRNRRWAKLALPLSPRPVSRSSSRNGPGVEAAPSRPGLEHDSPSSRRVTGTSASGIVSALGRLAQLVRALA